MSHGPEREVLAIESELIGWRRHLHAHPELSFEEVRTTRYIEEQLRGLGGVTVAKPTRTGLVASVRGEKPGTPAAVGIRADIDALPISEETGLPFASRVPGVMHACGHDGHAAMLLATARLLSEHRDSFCGEVRLLFQHAEELPPGGAIEMKRAGATDGLDCLMALHLSSAYALGTFGTKAGVLTAAVDRFDVRVIGKGGHCAFPESCRDPIVAAAAVITALQTIVSRRVPPQEPAVLSICRVEAGTAYNVIPEEVRLTGAVRTFSPETRKLVEEEVGRITEKTCEAFGVGAEVTYDRGYPSVVNDPDMTDLAFDVIGKQFGRDAALRIGYIMPGEDYAYFADDIPGVFLELGSRGGDPETARPHHSSRYRFDEKALLLGVQFFLSMCRTLLDGTRTRLPKRRR